MYCMIEARQPKVAFPNSGPRGERERDCRRGFVFRSLTEDGAGPAENIRRTVALWGGALS
ncbi:hypothetical protein OBV_35690 [Oscillibacter valericigenes Sjm18-20]|nr:hypothetical protein OBV_35690 [Oscillibacter valericigenes Sjm18-20]